MTKLFSPCKLAIFDGCLIILILSRFLFPTLCYFNSDKTTTLYKSGYYIIYVYIRYTYTQKKTQSGLNDDILVNNKMLNLTVFTHIQIYQQISIHIYIHSCHIITLPQYLLFQFMVLVLNSKLFSVFLPIFSVLLDLTRT